MTFDLHVSEDNEDFINEERSRPLHGGFRYRFDFPNGYSASVVKHKFSYGSERDLWELAIMKGDEIVYDTPIADDTIGWLTDEQVDELLNAIRKL